MQAYVHVENVTNAEDYGQVEAQVDVPADVANAAAQFLSSPHEFHDSAHQI